MIEGKMKQIPTMNLSACARKILDRGRFKQAERQGLFSAEYEAEQKELTEFVKTEQAAVDTYEQDRADFDSFAVLQI